MDFLEVASSAISEGLRAKRVGRPVSVQIISHSTNDTAWIERVLGRALETAAAWLDADWLRLAALGNVDSGPVSVVVHDAFCGI